MTKKFQDSPLLARVLPFVLFLILTSAQGQLGESSRYWIYLLKTLLGAVLVWATWPVVAEMRWAMSSEAVVTGVAVFAIWVGLDGLYPPLDELLRHIGLGSLAGKPHTGAPNWNPHAQFGTNTPLAWLFIATRIVGSSLVVPPLEEVFYRSFLYRYIRRPEFQTVKLGDFFWVPFLATACIFGLTHFEWLAGTLCGFAYQGLVCKKKRLGDAMTAHAITNFLLGIWVVWRGAWHFW